VWYVVVWCSITARQCGSESTQKVSGSSPGRDDILVPTQYDDDDDDRSGERLILPRKDRDHFLYTRMHC
jgi:hypothetical protein